MRIRYCWPYYIQSMWYFRQYTVFLKISRIMQYCEYVIGKNVTWNVVFHAIYRISGFKQGNAILRIANRFTVNVVFQAICRISVNCQRLPWRIGCHFLICCICPQGEHWEQHCHESWRRSRASCSRSCGKWLRWL